MCSLMGAGGQRVSLTTFPNDSECRERGSNPQAASAAADFELIAVR
jgi:hypothetical protein